jgi:hypothetical protein
MRYSNLVDYSLGETVLVARRFKERTCALCQQRPSSRKAEHVWTKWFLDMFPSSDGPYQRFIGGEVETKSDGATPRCQTSAERIQIPCCEACNGILNQRFEGPARRVVRSIMKADGQLSLDAQGAQTAGVWFLKTWLLLAHPLAESSWPGRTHGRFDLNTVPDDLYRWMIAGEDPPDGLSVWAHRQDLRLERAAHTMHVEMPEVVVGGVHTRFQASRCGVGFLDISVVYHPGWPIDHPLEAQGRALRLWPPRSDGCDFASLSPVPERSFAWLWGPTLYFAGAALPPELPALAANTNLLFAGLPQVIRAAAPPCSSAVAE